MSALESFVSWMAVWSYAASGCLLVMGLASLIIESTRGDEYIVAPICCAMAVLAPAAPIVLARVEGFPIRWPEHAEVVMAQTFGYGAAAGIVLAAGAGVIAWRTSCNRIGIRL